MLNQKQKIIIIIGIAIIAIVIIYYYIISTKDIYNYEQVDEIVETEESPEEKQEEQKIIVHITGEVKNNGIVEVKENARINNIENVEFLTGDVEKLLRINDVIEAAGGVTEEADLRKVNLAYTVKDGQKIYIPNKKDLEDTEDLDIISEEPGTEVIEEENETKNNEIVNINTASKEELQSLPGIGESTANKIITYREQNGKFKAIEDIKNVSGIGDSKFETIKSHIKV